jgi:hypothetical protein
MKIVARIEKIGGEQYLLDGKVFDSFLSARREMTQRSRARRPVKIGEVSPVYPFHRNEDGPPPRGGNTETISAARQCG